MYNVRFIKYPSGCQVRVYSALTGYHAPPDEFKKDRDRRLVHVPIWDDETEQYMDCIMPPDGFWFNPFTFHFEPAPREFLDEEDVMADLEKKKKRSIASSMGRTVNSVYHTARSNTWDWFVTLTFDPDRTDSFDYALCTKKLSDWLSRMRRLSPSMGYIMVPEKHRSGRYHFHGLFRDCSGIAFIPSGKVSGSGLPIYNVGSYRFGFSTATAVTDQAKVTKYIAKYITKDLCQVAFGKKRYWASRNLQDAEVQEAVLDKDQLRMLLGRLESEASYVKRLECSEYTTTYYELPPGVDLNEI